MNQSAWSEVALAKLSSVVGKAKADEVYAAGLTHLGMTELRSADDLYRFAQHVSKLEGFVGAVGALLSVHAVLHGATGRPRKPS